jgi:hypothetical protein
MLDARVGLPMDLRRYLEPGLLQRRNNRPVGQESEHEVNRDTPHRSWAHDVIPAMVRDDYFATGFENAGDLSTCNANVLVALEVDERIEGDRSRKRSALQRQAPKIADDEWKIGIGCRRQSDHLSREVDADGVGA